MDQKTKKGTLLAIVAYTLWGFFPIYWKFLSEVSSVEIVSHRMIWTGFFLYGILRLKNNSLEFSKLQKKHLLLILSTALLIASNWWVYIFAVNSNHILDASLGYFISPLMSLGLGFFILKEKLNGKQIFAIGLATLGVLILTSKSESIPWVALYLALSFSLYGFVRKKIKIPALNTTTLESFMMAPVALIILIHTFTTSHEVNYSSTQWALLILGGAITGLPLWLFNEAAHLLPLTSLGFYQYLSPSMQFLTAVLIYGEPFDGVKLICFSLIWIGLGIYTFDLFKWEKDHN